MRHRAVVLRKLRGAEGADVVDALDGGRRHVAGLGARGLGSGVWGFRARMSSVCLRDADMSRVESGEECPDVESLEPQTTTPPEMLILRNITYTPCELLVPEDSEALLESKLEPVTASHAVPCPVVKVLVGNHSLQVEFRVKGPWFGHRGTSCPSR